MSAYLDTYVDANGVEIVAGDRIRMAGWPWADQPVLERPVLTVGLKPLTECEACGVIVRFEDPDGDVDDETGRSIMIPAAIHVRFDDGTEDHYQGHWTGGYMEDDAPWEFEDVEKIPSGSSSDV